ncbi:MAG: hypothetical protein JSR77_10570 [Planctomycetes bacterium]|nr:hypothetical protein [Planctomycetota bacterium]
MILRTRLGVVLLAAGVVVAAPVCVAQNSEQPAAKEQSVDQRVAEIKASLGRSQATLKNYEWMETTTILLKGEEKSKTVNRCYYGADGKVQKVPVEAPAAEEPGRGLRGKIKAKKKEELADYMKRAVALVKSYVPPAPDRVQGAKEKGRVSIKLVEPGKRADVVFADYEQVGDSLTISLDIAANRLTGVEVSTYLDESVKAGQKPKDPVTMKIKESAFEDGTVYTEKVELDAPSKNMKVVVEHSGYRKVSGEGK